MSIMKLTKMIFLKQWIKPFKIKLIIKQQNWLKDLFKVMCILTDNVGLITILKTINGLKQMKKVINIYTI